MSASAVLFDLDGTLLDTAPDLVGAVNELRHEHGLDTLPRSVLAPMCSYGARGMLERGLDLRPGDNDYEATYHAFIDRYQARLTRETAPYPGIRALITELVERGWHWGVVTNKAEALAVPLMQTMGFEPPPGCVVGGDSAHAPKPDPAPIELGLAHLGASAAGSIYVGDSARDMQAGRAAKLHTIGAAYGYIPADEDPATWQSNTTVTNAADIESAINELAPTES
ncbi:HAD family hydrolase [Salinisphaera orenii]|uniref:HAD family hydrolase n=1 Tax=Salinisphaera orenii TaxID=856731 RepID=UPI000DBE85E3